MDREKNEKPLWGELGLMHLHIGPAIAGAVVPGCSSGLLWPPEQKMELEGCRSLGLLFKDGGPGSGRLSWGGDDDYLIGPRFSIW